MVQPSWTHPSHTHELLLCNRCSHHARVCSGETRCREISGQQCVLLPRYFFHHHPGHTFIPALVETYGYLGKPLVRFLNTLSEVVAVPGTAMTDGSFLAGAHGALRWHGACQPRAACPLSTEHAQAPSRVCQSFCFVPDICNL